jgi:hypothetical protein
LDGSGKTGDIYPTTLALVKAGAGLTWSQRYRAAASR